MSCSIFGGELISRKEAEAIFLEALCLPKIEVPVLLLGVFFTPAQNGYYQIGSEELIQKAVEEAGVSEHINFLLFSAPSERRNDDNKIIKEIAFKISTA